MGSRKCQPGCTCLRHSPEVQARKSARMARHGDARRGKRTPEYRAWYSVHQRCSNPKVYRYDRYGGRGIGVCERWQEFENFLADMGRRPGPGYSIDRVDNDGDYEPGNCRWATRVEQVRTTRRCAPNCKCGKHEGNGGREKARRAALRKAAS